MRIKINLNIGLMMMLLIVFVSHISFASILRNEEPKSGELISKNILFESQNAINATLINLPHNSLKALDGKENYKSVIFSQANLACVPVVGGSTISASATGNNVTAGFATEYLLTNASGSILEHNSTGSFVAPNITAEYRIYAINYTTSTTPVFVGSSISALQLLITNNTICADISTTPKCFDVTKSTPACTNVVAGTPNGITATASGNNVSPSYSTSYVLTNTSGVIQNSNATGTFDTPATPGEYRVYAINYTSTTVPNMTNGTNIASIQQAIDAETICADISTIPKCFTVTPCTPPVVSLQGGGSSVTICGTGANAVLTATGCTGGVITWSNGATGNTITVTPLSTTIYTATCTIGTCVSVASSPVTVTVAPPTVPTVTATHTSIRIGESSALSATCATGTPSWFTDALLTLPLGSTTVSPLVNTTYYVSCGIGSCFTPANITINVVSPKISLMKTGIVSTDGNTITYTFTAKNTGDVTLNPVTVTDVKMSPSTITLGATSLAPGATTTGTATYTLTPADKTLGSVTNTATASGTPPIGQPVTDVSGTTFDNDTPTIVTVPGADLKIVKAVDNSTPTLGSIVTFTIIASNDGPNNATGVSVLDNIPAGYTVVSVTPSVGTWSAPNWTIGNLANGANVTLTVVATVNSAGPYANTATITGNEPDPDPTNNTDTETPTPPAAAPKISLLKTGVLNTGGNTITYTFTVKNTGNVPLNPVTVTDVKLTPTSVTLAATSLAVGETTTGTATYTVTPAEKIAGIVTNTATATGTPPTGPNVTDISGTTFDNDTLTEVIVPCVPDLNPAITVIPNNGIQGQVNMGIKLDIKEILGCNTDSTKLIRITIPKSAYFSFNWIPFANATEVSSFGFTGLENSDWNYTETTSSYIWTYNKATFNASSISNIGFEGIWNAGASSGTHSFTVTIVNGSGGEINVLNNIDYDKVTFDVEP